ncbi:MAG TPA: hypothetical protein VFS00_34665, partial [Polyangiaceae bacterium]|nr:hypothetical protein [Polyangiaceae bacterium]
MAAEGLRPPGAAAEDDDESALRAHFAAARPDLEAPAELGSALRSALAAARAAWPDLDVPAGPFVRFVAGKLPRGEPPARSLAALRTTDLYLACACCLGDARAFAHFERLCLAAI